MAIIDKRNDEYHKIIREGCYANIDGLYLHILVFESKKQRDKDKNISDEIQNFTRIIHDLEKSFDYENGNVEDDNPINFAMYLDRFVHIVNEEHNGISDIDQNLLNAVKELGFKEEWFTDPIRIKREMVIRAKDYENDGFEITDLYSIMNDRYVDQEQGITFGKEGDFKDDI